MENDLLIEEYKKDLEKAASEKASGLVFNDGPIKANIFMSTLLSHATQTVYIYSHNLHKDVTGIDGFEKTFEAILKNPEIQVFILLNEETNNKNLKSLIYKYVNQQNNPYTNLLKYVKDTKCIKAIFKNEVHFSVIDGIFYRKEYDIDGYKAQGSFNDIEYSKGLEKLFKHMWINCSK